MNHFFGFTPFTRLGQRQGRRAVQDAWPTMKNNLKRHADFVALIDRAIARFRQGQQTASSRPS
jgi:hypothetical protein